MASDKSATIDLARLNTGERANDTKGHRDVKQLTHWLQRESLPRIIACVGLGVSILLFALPYLHFGFHHGDDSAPTLYRVRALAACVRAMDVPCVWANDLASGLGSPVFLFYPTAALWIPALLGLGIDSFSRALELSAVINHIALAGAAFFVARPFASGTVAITCSVVLSLAPYHLLLLNHRSAFSEAWGLVASLVVLGCWSRIVVGDKPSGDWRSRGPGVVGLAAALCLLLWAHPLVTALFTFPFAILHLLMWRQVLANKFTLGGSYALAMLLGAHQWVPLVLERGNVHLERATTTGFFSFENHFYIPWHELVMPGRGVWPARLGIFIVLALVMTLGFNARKRNRPSQGEQQAAQRLTTACVACALIAELLVMPVTMPLWRALPTLKYAQFPWRHTGVALAFAAVPLAWGMEQVVARATQMDRRFRWLPIVVLAACIAWYWPALKLKRASHWSDAQLFAPAYFAKAQEHGAMDYLPTTASATEFKQRSKETIDWPIAWLEPSNAGAIRKARQGPQSMVLTATLQASASLLFSTVYFPGWEVESQHGPLPVTVDDKHRLGLIRIELPEGEHHIVARFGPTPSRQVASGLSLVAAMLSMLALGVSLTRRRRSSCHNARESGGIL